MKLTVGKGIDNYISELERISNATDDMIGKAVYAGADIIADEIRRNIENLPSVDTAGTSAAKVTGLRTIQKKGLLDGLGIAKKQTDMGYVHVKVGFDGYNGLKTSQYPKGQPNAMIARTFESGNSFTKKMPFVAPAVRDKREAAERKMADVIDTEVSKYIK